MTPRSGGTGGLPQPLENNGARTRRTAGKAVGLWVSLAAVRAASELWAPAAVAEYSAAVWVVGLLPVLWLGSRRGSWGAWGAAGGLILTVSVVEAGLVEAMTAPGPVLAGVLGAAVVMAAGTTRLVGEQQRQMRRTLRAALEDPETGLLSRRGLEIVFEREVAEARRGGTLSVVLLGLTGYEQLTDRDKEDVRAQVLSEVGSALDTNSRGMDTVGRLEENRFLAVLPETEPNGASTFAERVCAKLASIAVSSNGGSVVDSGVEARAGIAVWTADGAEDQQSLLDRAEQALQLALSGEHGRVIDEQHVRSHKSSGRIQRERDS